MKTFLANMMSGYAGYVFLAIAVGSVGFYFHYKDLRADHAALKTELQIAQKQISNYNLALRGVAASQARETAAQDDLKEREDAIRQLEETRVYVASPALMHVLRGMHDATIKPSQNSDGEQDVPMPQSAERTGPGQSEHQ